MCFVATLSRNASGFLSSQWQENPGLLESQVQSVAMAQQATLEMEFKRREAVYRDVLNRQQSVRTRKPRTKSRPGGFGQIKIKIIRCMQICAP